MPQWWVLSWSSLFTWWLDFMEPLLEQVTLFVSNTYCNAISFRVIHCSGCSVITQNKPEETREILYWESVIDLDSKRRTAGTTTLNHNKTQHQFRPVLARKQWRTVLACVLFNTSWHPVALNAKWSCFTKIHRIGQKETNERCLVVMDNNFQCDDLTVVLLWTVFTKDEFETKWLRLRQDKMFYYVQSNVEIADLLLLSIGSLYILWKQSNNLSSR